MSEAVVLNVAVAAIDLEGMVVVVSPKTRGKGEIEIPTDLMEKCDNPQIICLRENGRVNDNCRFR